MTAEPEAPAYERLILAIAGQHRTGMNAATAEEMTQEVLLTVWHKAAQFTPARANADAWIFGIARNLQIDAQRRGRLAVPMVDPSDEAPPVPLSDALIAAERSARSIRSAVLALPAEQLNILRLVFFEDLSHSEIERRLGVPLGTIKSRLRLAMAKLRFALKDET